jgi:predicted nucleic acid-binding Zn ribbon protein
MERSKKFGEIKDNIDRVLKKSELFFDFKIFRLKNRWKTIVGEQLGAHTWPYKILYNQTLVVSCDHQGWVSSMQFYKKDILEKLHTGFSGEYDGIIDIKFVFYNKRKDL